MNKSVCVHNLDIDQDYMENNYKITSYSHREIASLA